jgi:predicted metal-binding membrane protein
MTHVAFLPLAAMCFAMMTAMMVPTVWPWIVVFDRLHDPHRNGWCPPSWAPKPWRRRPGGWTRIASFSSGYAAAWLVYSLAAASMQMLLPHELSRGLTASILLAAGAFQFAPLKRACLMHCRNPLTYFLAHWRDGAAGSFGMGMHHGLFCVACCWALMATTLAVGVMSIWWMAALAAATFAEQVMPWGNRARVAVGAALLIGAAWYSALGGALE